MPSLLRFPRPRSFLHIIPLPTATEFISFTLAINKLTGLYGILALLTGYHLNILQLSHYLYSLAVLGLIIYLSPAIREQPTTNTVLKTLALAWVYVVDSLVNSVYTALFGTSWFLILAQHLSDENGGGVGKGVPGADTMNDTAGFTSPEHPGVSHVDVVAAPAAQAAGANTGNLMAGQVGVAYASSGSSALGGVLFERGSVASLTVLVLLWVIRVYFCLVVLSFARSTVRQYIASSSSTSTTTPYLSTDDATMAPDPFHSTPGLPGRLGRAMLRFPTRRYWLGRDEGESEWERATAGRFEAGRGLRIKVPKEEIAGGVGERERRARSGTGPPVPGPGVKGKVPQ